jgi:enterochelin esterase-like enzyme
MRDSISVFESLRQRVEAATDAVARQAIVDAWIAQGYESPLLGADEAIIWYSGPGADVVLRGDMLQERSERLSRLTDTSFWYHHGRYEPDAYLEYHLLVDGADVGDPRNPRTAPSGYGPRAALRMPHYESPGWWITRPDVPQGQIDHDELLTSAAYGTTHRVRVYLPPGYESSRRYPSVYFGDGGDYLNFAQATTIFDNLIAAGTIPSSIAVFIDPSIENGRAIDYDLNLRYVAFVCDELTPWINARYATHDRPDQRVIAGASFGGLIALLIAHERPEVFGQVISQSGFVSRRSDAIIERYLHESLRPLLIHLIIGAYETHVGPLEPGSAEADFLRGNRRLRDVLQARGYRFAYAEYPAGHGWGLWRDRLGAALLFLLGPSA